MVLFSTDLYTDGDATKGQQQAPRQWIPTAEELINSDNIPVFMKDYFRWHGKELEKLHKDSKQTGNDNDNGNGNDEYLAKYRFLVLRCAGTDRCGGTSDRLKTFPLFIWYAATTNRILLFRWGSRPASLESFLTPGPYWNWTVPDVVMRKIDEIVEDSQRNNTKGGVSFSHMYFDPRTKIGRKRTAQIGDQAIWMVEGNDFSGGANKYAKFVNSVLNDTSSSVDLGLVPRIKVLPRDAQYKNFYHDLFHATFRPSQGVEQKLSEFFCDAGQIQDNDNDNDLSPSSPAPASASCLPIPLQHNRYVVAHFRAKYPGTTYRETNNKTWVRETTYHAVTCAKTRVGSSLSSTTEAVYLASDTALVLDYAREAYPNPPNAGSKLDGGDPSVAPFPVWTNLDPKAYARAGSTAPTDTSILAVDPPHLNFAKPDDVSEFDSIFVDLFLMSYSNCVVFGPGGFGRWGSLVSFRPWCGAEFARLRKSIPCDPYDAD
eukprot:jgi/Psemu1/325846/estExt_fgenesh1_pg.C_2890009